MVLLTNLYIPARRNGVLKHSFRAVQLLPLLAAHAFFHLWCSGSAESRSWSLNTSCSGQPQSVNRGVSDGPHQRTCQHGRCQPQESIRCHQYNTGRLARGVRVRVGARWLGCGRRTLSCRWSALPRFMSDDTHEKVHRDAQLRWNSGATGLARSSSLALVDRVSVAACLDAPPPHIVPLFARATCCRNRAPRTHACVSTEVSRARTIYPEEHVLHTSREKPHRARSVACTGAKHHSWLVCHFGSVQRAVAGFIFRRNKFCAAVDTSAIMNTQAVPVRDRPRAAGASPTRRCGCVSGGCAPWQCCDGH